jgi:early secretory antigenic target protein ESAT-6
MSILVNYATITNASTDVRTTAGRIKSQLDDLEAAVKRVANTWEGEAQEGYRKNRPSGNQPPRDFTRTCRKFPPA